MNSKSRDLIFITIVKKMSLNEIFSNFNQILNIYENRFISGMKIF